ncbi:hypothetical protein Dimus_019548 [Dionaea muscipula]
MTGGGAGKGDNQGGGAPPLQLPTQQPPKPAKFLVYQNQALSAALTATSLRPSAAAFVFMFSLSSASAFALLAFSSWEDGILNYVKFSYVSEEIAYVVVKVAQILVGLAFSGALFSLVKVIFLRRIKIDSNTTANLSSNGTHEKMFLTNHQLRLLGLQPNIQMVAAESSKKSSNRKSLTASAAFDALVPIHHLTVGSDLPLRIISDISNTGKSNTGGGSRIQAFGTASKSPSSPSSSYLVPPASSQSPSTQTPPSLNKSITSPWSKSRASPAREMNTEEELEQFLADLDKKITESAEKLATPPTARSGFNIGSPLIPGPANTSGTIRPLRPVRMSPGSQKFSTPPKKGEGDLPSPMSMKETIEAFEHLGIYPQIEEWRDRLRQWFSSVLLTPLLSKIETSHIQIMEAASKLGLSITVSQVGSDSPTAGSPAIMSTKDPIGEWQPAMAVDEDGLHHFRASLVQTLDAATQRPAMTNVQQSPQQSTLISIIQECVDAITEHQRLHTLMKGELIKGLLPQSSIPAEYTVQRIRELAEGTCLRNYEYLRSNEIYDKVKKKYTLELPDDCHLLLYLFCAFLEYPRWMLHVDPASYSGAQSSKNTLFLGVLPPKERFPEKYIAVISGVPSILHPGACILTIGRQSPPIIVLYWDKKSQISLQGRTALWDSILLLCHRINIGFGGFVRGIHLGSSALSILPVFQSEDED